MGRTKQTARKVARSSQPAASVPRMRVAASSSHVVRSGAVQRPVSNAAVVLETISTPYEREMTTRTEYKTKELANAVVLERWEEFRTGYELVECQLFRNRAGYCKFHMEDEEGTAQTLEAQPSSSELDWELVEEGESATGRSDGGVL